MLPLLVALVPSLLFGVLSPLLMRLGGDSRQQTIGQLAGGALFAGLVSPFLHVHWTVRDFALSMLCGAALALGILWQIRCLHVLGVSRTMPISTGGQLIGVALGGVVLLGEWRSPGAFPVGALGLAAIIAGIVLTARTERTEGAEGVAADWGRGVPLLVTSTVMLAGYVVALRVFDIDGTISLFPVLLGSALTAVVMTSPRLSPGEGAEDTRWRAGTARQLLSGLVFGAGMLVMLFSNQMVGVATGFTLSQLGVVITTVLGIVWLGERRSRRELVWIALGVAYIVVGAVLIGVAKGLDG